jgi:hypothetical protein
LGLYRQQQTGVDDKGKPIFERVLDVARAEAQLAWRRKAKRRVTQIELYLPPPITAHEAAAIIGHLGGKARAEKARAPIRAKCRELRDELGLSRLTLDCRP